MTTPHTQREQWLKYAARLPLTMISVPFEGQEIQNMLLLLLAIVAIKRTLTRRLAAWRRLAVVIACVRWPLLQHKKNVCVSRLHHEIYMLG